MGGSNQNLQLLPNSQLLPKFSTFARAKINLSLNILGKRNDGYHELESLVVFADFGDRLELDCSKPLGLSIEGPFGQKTGDIKNNLILKAVDHLVKHYPDLCVGHFTLVKEIPVAAGLGGGSSDAAAALQLLAKANNNTLDEPVLFNIAKNIGADVPICLKGRACFMKGIGDRLEEELDLPELYAVLVNPGYAVTTGDVFKELAAPAWHANHVLAEKFDIKADFIAWLKAQRNDLETPAIKLQLKIADVLTVLAQTLNPQIVRMSGSGATCFAVYETEDVATQAEQILKKQYQDWWIRSVILNPNRLT